MRGKEGSKLASCGRLGAILFFIAASIASFGQASAQTLPTTLVLAYQNNPQLNAQRAQVRVTDEAVPQALSGYRPRLSVTASAAHSSQAPISFEPRRREIPRVR